MKTPPLMHFQPNTINDTRYGDFLINFGPFIITTLGIFTDFTGKEYLLTLNPHTPPQTIERRTLVGSPPKTEYIKCQFLPLYRYGHTVNWNLAPLKHKNFPALRGLFEEAVRWLGEHNEED